MEKPRLTNTSGRFLGGRLEIGLHWSDGLEITLSGEPKLELLEGFPLLDFLLGLELAVGEDCPALRPAAKRIIEERIENGPTSPNT